MNALQYYVEKKLQISGPPPVVSHTLMHIPNHEILTILAEVKISPPPTPFLPNLQKTFLFYEKKNYQPRPALNLPLQKTSKHLTNRASFTEKKVFYPNLVNAQLTQPKEVKVLATYH